MTTQIREVDFRSYEVTDAGQFAGCANRYGQIDSFGTVFVHGSFADAIPEFLKRGSIRGSHKAGIENEVAVLTNAFERADGLFIEAEYHEDEDTQKFRQKINKRKSKNQFVGLSVGFYPIEQITIRKEDYDRELPKWLDKATYAEQRQIANNFRVITIFTKAGLREVSIVTDPSNYNSGITASRSESLIDFIESLDKESSTDELMRSIFTHYVSRDSGVELAKQTELAIELVGHVAERSKAIEQKEAELNSTEHREGKVFSTTNINFLTKLGEDVKSWGESMVSKGTEVLDIVKSATTPKERFDKEKYQVRLAQLRTHIPNNQ